jgi:peptidoglycan hydrolase CwlO-like protein
VHTILFVSAFIIAILGIPFDRVLLVLTTIVSLEAIYLSIFIQMSVNRNEQRLDLVSEDIDEIQEDIEEISEDIEEISEDVGEIQEDVEQIEKDVDEIQEDIDEIQEEIEE